MNLLLTRRPDNSLLEALHDTDFNLIAPHLLMETLTEKDVLYEPGEDISRVYFPLGPSLVSFAVSNIEGHLVQAVLVGREGGVGGIVSAGGLPAYCFISVKSAGRFLSAHVSRVQSAKESSGTFRKLFERYADCLMSQMFQATACNAVHSVEQRAAKWILEESDRIQESVVHLNHDELASTLGVGRSYMTRVLRKLSQCGALKTSRGSIEVTDRAALVQRSCKCNSNVVHHFDRVLGGIYAD